MPLILSNHEEAPEVRRQWVQNFHTTFNGELASQMTASAEFARMTTDNVRSLAAYPNDCENVNTLITSALEEANDVNSEWDISPVEATRLRLLLRYTENLRQWRIVATRAHRQWRFDEDYGSGHKDPYFELPKDGWEERSNIERALHELEKYTDALPQGWLGSVFGEEEVEVVFDAGDAAGEGAGSGEQAAMGGEGWASGLVDYSDAESEDGESEEGESEDEEESEDDFVLTIDGQATYNGQPITEGYRIGDVFPGGEAEEEEPGSESDGSDDLDDLDLMNVIWEEDPLTSGPVHEGFDTLMDTLVAQTAGTLEEWEAANRETVGDFADGHFVP